MTEGASFGRVLKARRRRLDLTQDELAKQVGYSVITIRKIEADERRPSRPLAERLALVLDVSADERAGFITLARAEPGWTAARPQPRHTATPARVRTRTNLPTPLTRLVGRDDETDAVVRILDDDDVRLVTLVGPPGIGKSRLGLRVAGTVRAGFPDGVLAVPLATVGDPLLVLPTIAKTLDISEQADRLGDFLRERRLLLLLDDFEHVPAAAPDIARLLTACPGLKVLATSRSPLHLRGERLYQVPPLAWPAAAPVPDAATALRSPAVELFVERARDADPGFALTDADAPGIAAICAHLDGLPLAIELVAARVRLLTPAELAARIEHRLALLTGGPADLPARQQTLRRTIDWSYDLLDPGERTLFARTAVFNGGFPAEAAEEVTNARGDLPLAVADGLDALVTKNLLGREECADGGWHLVLLETIREYALERLAALGEESEVRDRHAAYYLRLAESAAPHLTSREQHQWLDRLETARDNLRGALEWYAHRGATDRGLRLVAALWKFWHIRSRPTEGHRSIMLVLGSGESRDDAARARALHGAGWIALDAGDPAGALEWFEESLAVFRGLGQVEGVAEVLHGVGVCAQARGDQAGAASLFAESLDLYRELGADEGVAWSLDHLGDAMLNTGQYERAETLLAESLAIFRALRHTWGAAIALHHQGLTALARRDVPLAEARLRDSLALFAELDNCWGVATSHDHLGYAALERGDHARAREHFLTSLRRNHAEQDRDGFARSLAGLASLAVRQRRPELAGRLFGAADARSDGGGIRLDPVVRPIYERDAAAVRAALGDAATGRARRAGGGLGPAELLAAVGAGGGA